MSGTKAFVYMKLSSRHGALKSSPAWLSSIRPQEHLGVPWFESLNYLGPNPCTGRLHEMTECLCCVHIQWRLWHLRRRPGPVSRAVSQSPWVSQPEVTHYISSSCHAPLSVYKDHADMNTYCDEVLMYRWFKEDLLFWHCGIVYSQHRCDFANNALKK